MPVELVAELVPVDPLGFVGKVDGGGPPELALIALIARKLATTVAALPKRSRRSFTRATIVHVSRSLRAWADAVSSSNVGVKSGVTLRICGYLGKSNSTEPMKSR